MLTKKSLNVKLISLVGGSFAAASVNESGERVKRVTRVTQTKSAGAESGQSKKTAARLVINVISSKQVMPKSTERCKKF